MNTESNSTNSPGEGKKRVGVILCVCTGDCPGFSKMRIWDFVNQVRLALPVEWVVVHPQLCEEDGDRFLEEYLNPESALHYLIAGCSKNMQRKMFGPAFEAKGMDFGELVLSLDVREMTTDEAFELVEKALEDWEVVGDE